MDEKTGDGSRSHSKVVTTAEASTKNHFPVFACMLFMLLYIYTFVTDNSICVCGVVVCSICSIDRASVRFHNHSFCQALTAVKYIEHIDAI